MKDIKVSIVTVCLNSVETMEQTIRSVIHQTYRNIEYIIVDGGSTDGTLDIIAKYKNRITMWISESDNGLYDAMNKGIAMATGDVIGIINSDDWYDLQAVENVVNAFEKEKADIVYGTMEKVYSKGYTRRMKNESLEQMIYHMVIPHPTAFVRKSVYQKIGKFDLQYRIVADYDLFLRMYLNGLKMTQINVVITYFREGGVSTANAVECVNEERKVACYYAEQRQDTESIGLIEQNYQIRLVDAKNKEMVSKIVQYYRKTAKTILEKWKKDTTQLKIFGAGAIGMECFMFLKDLDVFVECFLDNNKAGTKVFETPVRECKLKSGRKEFIVVAVMNYQEEIIKQLEGMGYHYKKDFCTYYDFVEEIFKEVHSEVVE